LGVDPSVDTLRPNRKLVGECLTGSLRAVFRKALLSRDQQNKPSFPQHFA
jgi:hypothetical protein